MYTKSPDQKPTESRLVVASGWEDEGGGGVEAKVTTEKSGVSFEGDETY